MLTERFNKIRKSALEEVFEKKAIVSIWKNIVKNQLKQLDIKDLFDYYDFSYNIETRAASIRNDILFGSYKVSVPLIYRIEKKLGVCRHVIMPQPIDALVMQVIAESVSPTILSKQPSKNAFYSRDKHAISKAHEIDEYGLHWKDLWKKMQKVIYRFNDEKNLVITTDISNFYDSIDMDELRKQFMLKANTNEVLVDLLFRCIEEISWKPDYLPYSSRGLPTSNLEGIRLLSHSFLFEIDAVLKDITNNSFVRWMDDITIGVDTLKEGKEVLSSVSDVLKSRGLALNLSKTDVYDAEAGFYNFQIYNNQLLDTYGSFIEIGALSYVSENIKTTFEQHLDDRKPKYWDKITKRYITLFARMESTYLLEYIHELYIDYPSLRPNLILYLVKIGYNHDTKNSILRILKEISIFDDISLFQISNLLTTWHVPVDDSGKSFLKDAEASIEKFFWDNRTEFNYYCLIWFKTKYSHHEALINFITKTENIWQLSSFLRRQVTSSLARIYPNYSERVKRILNNQMSSGANNVIPVASTILEFAEKDKLDDKLNGYLFYRKAINVEYTLPRFLVLCSVLNSENVRMNKTVRKDVLDFVRDPYYRKWIEQNYDIS